jgi:hypothetical protein
MSAKCIGTIEYHGSIHYVWQDVGLPENKCLHYFGLSQSVTAVPYCAYGNMIGMFNSKGFYNAKVKPLRLV